MGNGENRAVVPVQTATLVSYKKTKPALVREDSRHQPEYKRCCLPEFSSIYHRCHPNTGQSECGVLTSDTSYARFWSTILISLDEVIA